MPLVKPCQMEDCKDYRELTIEENHIGYAAKLFPEGCLSCRCWVGVDLYRPKKKRPGV